jgi:integrase
VRRVYTFEGIALNAKSTEKDIATVLTQARSLHQEQRNQLATGLDVAIERDLNAKAVTATPTVSEFASTFIERYAKPKNKAWAEQDRILKADVIPHIGSLKIDAVKRPHIIALLDKKEDTGALVARNRLLSLLSKYFGYALERGLIEVNPATGIKKLPEQTRERVLTDEEIKQLWAFTSKQSHVSLSNRLVLRLALITGQRIGELCQMSKDQIQGNLWTIPDTKNGLPHTVPLTPLALSIIEEAQPHSGDRLIFPNSKGAVIDSHTIARVMSRFDWTLEPSVDRPTPHDLRRTFTTGISQLGFNRLIQDKVTNHKDNSVGGIYDRNDYQKEKRQALEAWERHLNEVLTGEPVSNVIAFKTA